jgi:light-regulated signal transduction histidine kinase (bacteriophytochrome)
MTTSFEAALANCSKEPIHVPGAIQPFGVLFALEGESTNLLDLCISRYSMNAAEAVDCSGTLIGRKINELLTLDVVPPIVFGDFTPREPVGVVTQVDGTVRNWHAFVHRHRGELILELERLEHSVPPPDVLAASLREALAQLESSSAIADLCNRACMSIKALTGLDRVMAYKFHEDDHGEVIAECKDSELVPYLGLHYPASDIPSQARALFLDNWVRMIPDRDYQPVPIAATQAAAPCDLGRAMLRSVSSIHIEYLRNMGVRASLTLSLISGGKLWGLIAAHHNRGPKHVPFETRAACETVARITSLLLPQTREIEVRGARDRAKQVHAELLAEMRRQPNVADGLVRGSATLRDLVDCDGAAVLSDDGHWLTVGHTPNVAELSRFAAWIDTNRQEEVFHTDHLMTHYPSTSAGADAGTHAFSAVASGVLAVRIPKGHANYLMWFKPEVTQTVRWAGDPQKPVVDDAGNARLHPRHSFEEWQQTVRHRSLPWTQVDIDAVTELNHAIAAVDLQRQFEREQEARAHAEWAGEQKEHLLSMVSHDLKNPLHSLMLQIALFKRMLGDEAANRVAPVLAVMERALERMNRLVSDLLSISKVESGAMGLEIEVHQAVDILRDICHILQPIARDKGVSLEVTNADGAVRCDRDRILQVLSNIVGNAVKFTPNGGLVTMSAEVTPREIRFVVSDSGSGIPAEHLEFVFDRFWQARRTERLGTGLGLAIAKGIVEAHGGRIWAESKLGNGSIFRFTLPAAVG